MEHYFIEKQKRCQSKFFKKIEHKLTFIVKNINFLIAALTGIVAISSLYKMYF